MWSVEKTEVAGQRRLHCDVGGLEVADFADEDHVRVLPHDRAQAIRKGVARFVVHLRLFDALDAILDRIFEGDYFLRRIIDGAQERVKCRCFSGAGRAGV